MTTVNETKEESEVKNVAKYKKRQGTSGIAAFLYRSRLLGIILCRNRNNEIEFVLGCNVDDVGVMNEICFRFHHKENERKPAAVFIKTKYTGDINDDDLTNPKSAINLYKCNRSRSLIKDRFDNNPDALFQGKFDDIAPYFIIYSPHKCNIKNLVNVTRDDRIYTDKVDSIINTETNSKLFKVQGSNILTESLVTDLINARIEIIAKTIVECVTSNDLEKTNKVMDRILMKYKGLLIPHVIEIDKQDNQYKAKFNESLDANSNSQIKLLRQVLLTELLKKSKVIDEEASHNIQLLLETSEYTTELLSKLIGTVITFNNQNGKLAYIDGVSNSFKSQSLDSIKVEKSIADEAFVIAGMNALKCIEIHLKDVDVALLIQKQDGEIEQKMSASMFEDEKQLAESFLNHLYVYAEQIREHDLDKRLQEEIIKIQANKQNATIIQNKPEEACLKFVYKVQDWMQYREESQYLTNNCDIWEDAIVDLNFLNYNCITELQSHGVMFNNKSLISFSKLNGAKSHTNIISDTVLLTSIKLMQYMLDKQCLFVNFGHVCNMENMEFSMLIQDIKKTPIQTLVVICYDNKNHPTKSDKFKQIVITFPGDVTVVTNKPTENFETIYDTVKGLDDIYNAHELLTHGITVQGEKVELGKILDRNTVKLVSAEVLEKIIKKESIVIGKSLSNSFYDEIKDCFMDRNLSKYNCYSLECRSDFYMSSYNCENLDLRPNTSESSNTMIAIYAEPGMGKSILFTHLSVKTKRDYPKIWIVKMNLLNYSEDFFNWDAIETDVDIIKSMYLVCKAELNNKEFDNLFALEKGSEGELILTESNELDPIAALHLKLIIHCFNAGNIIFFFDGFDEICPNYLNVVIQFLKNIGNIDSFNDESEFFDTELPNANEYIAYFIKEPVKKNQVLITSRPYNTILTTLKTELNIKSLYLIRLAKEEQYNFYIKYWETRIKLEELNSDQFQNVEAFFKHVNQYRRHSDLFLRSTISYNMLLRRMQEAAIFYFRRKARLLTDGHIYKKSMLSGWPLSAEMLSYNNSDDDCLEELQLSGIPLHMKIHADIFVNQIKDTSSTKQWDMGVHTFEFYKRYLEIKLKKIRFEQKGGENVHTSSFLTEYKDLVEEVTEEHKKLAFYAFFQEYGSSHYEKVLSETKWKAIETIIKRIAEAKDKTGLIDRIHNGVPRFVHVIFAEYYAVEYIADMLKQRPLSHDQVYRQIDFIVNCVLKSSVGIMTAFNYKLMHDLKLRKGLDKNYAREYIFNAWMKPDISSVDNKKNKTLIKKILRHGFIEIAWLLLKSVKDTLNSVNIEHFIDLIGKDFFQFAIKYDVLVKYVLDAIRRIDSSMLDKALSHCGLELRDFSENEIIINNLRERYKYGLALRRA